MSDFKRCNPQRWCARCGCDILANPTRATVQYGDKVQWFCAAWCTLRPRCEQPSWTAPECWWRVEYAGENCSIMKGWCDRDCVGMQYGGSSSLSTGAAR